MNELIDDFNTAPWFHDLQGAREILDIDDADEVRCEVCSKPIQGGYVGVYAGAYHWKCFEKSLEWCLNRSIVRAERACKLAPKLPEYNPGLESWDDYIVSCQQRFTNFHRLTRNLQRYDLRDEVYRVAIETRIAFLVDAAVGECPE